MYPALPGLSQHQRSVPQLNSIERLDWFRYPRLAGSCFVHDGYGGRDYDDDVDQSDSLAAPLRCLDRTRSMAVAAALQERGFALVQGLPRERRSIIPHPR